MNTCPTCGVETTPFHGRRTLCLKCTLAELGYRTLKAWRRDRPARMKGSK